MHVTLKVYIDGVVLENVHPLKRSRPATHCRKTPLRMRISSSSRLRQATTQAHEADDPDRSFGESRRQSRLAVGDAVKLHTEYWELLFSHRMGREQRNQYLSLQNKHNVENLHDSLELI